MAVWTRIQRYPEYEISDDGQVRHVGGRVLKAYELRPSKSQRYLAVSIAGRNQIVARLLAESFIPWFDGHRISYRDGDSMHVSLSNISVIPRMDLGQKIDPKKERWASAYLFDHEYQVSSEGRVRNLAKKIVKPCLVGRKQKYLQVKLRDTKGTVHGVMLSRLVLASFNRPASKREEANHIDFNTLNNKLKNLEWLTKSKHGKHTAKGKRRTYTQPRNNIHPLKIAYAMGLKEAGLSVFEIESMLRVPYTTLVNALKCKTIVSKHVASVIASSLR